MRFIYTVLFYFLVPIVLLRLYWRGFKAHEYRKRWAERLAIYKYQYPQNVIWIHAVSVGEAEAVFPLVKCLQKQYPSGKFLITTTTPTGSARVKAVLAETVSHVYFPYDLPCVVSRFLKIFKPRIAIFMEKEIWPNLYAQCANKQIPLMIINARLSANSAKGYKKIPALVKPALAHVSWLATQTEEDRRRFVDIGAIESRCSVAGNLKFDLEADEALIKQALKIKDELFAKRFVWIIASTHEGEEAVFYKIYSQLKKQIPELLLLIVPRHPERFGSVRDLAEKMQLKTCLRSSAQECLTATDVYIADTMGELKLLYGTADVCFVGGSMVPVGGHNILEPAVLNIPIMFGPYMINFKQIAENVLTLGAAKQCADEEELIENLLHLYNNAADRNAMAVKAKQFVTNNQGTTERIANIAEKLLN